MPRIALTFLQIPWGGIWTLINPTVDASASDSAKQLCWDNGSILQCSQHPSLYLFAGVHDDTSGHVGAIEVMKVSPLLTLQAKVVQLSSLLHSAPTS